MRPSFPSLASGPSGEMVIAFPVRSETDWDVVVRGSTDGGRVWFSTVSPADYSGGPQWLPAVAVGADGTVHAAWYDGRSGDTNLLYARSRDGGESWSPNARLNQIPTKTTGVRLGDYLGVAGGSEGEAFVVWTDGRGDDLDIYFNRVGG